MAAQLGELEMQEVLTVTKRLSRRCNYSIVLDDLLKKWSTFVAQCEQGYSDYIDEYRNDIGARNLLQEVIEGVSLPVSEKIREMIVQVDRRFLETTVPISVPLIQLDREPTEMEQILYFRIPKKRGGDLQEDLQSLSI